MCTIGPPAGPLSPKLAPRWLLAAALLALGACTGEPQPDPSAGNPRHESFTETIRGTEVTFAMVWVPAGGFWIGKHEVTWDEYLLYCDFDQEHKAPPGVDGVTKPSEPLPDVAPFDRDWGLGRRPAVGMSRNAAAKYCEWLSINTGRRFRLPTEAEWTLALGPWPEGDLTEYAWLQGNSDEMTQEVGQKKPNSLGIHDMIGNLWEYCSDPYSAGEPKRPVLRGGCWDSPADELRPDSRLGFEYDWVLEDPNVPRGVWWVPDGNHLGFRVLCEPAKRAP